MRTNPIALLSILLLASTAWAQNIASRKPVTASGQSDVYDASRAVDGNADGTSYWESAANAWPQWIRVDLQSTYNLDRLVLKIPGNWGARDQTLAVEGSTDDATYSTIVSSAKYSFNPSSSNAVTIPCNSKTARYVRLTFTANSGWAAAQLSEFEVYGTAAGGGSGGGSGGGGSGGSNGTPLKIKSAQASATTQDYTAAKAIDGDLTTYWEGGLPSTLTADLGSNADVTGVVVKLNPDSAWSRRTQTIQILGQGQDSTTFTNLVSAASYTFDPATGNSVTIPVTAKAQAIQLQFTQNSGAGGGQVAELQILGTPAPNPDLTVSSATWSPSSPTEAQPITVSAVVKNIGKAASPATTVNFYLGNTLVGNATVGALQPSASATVTANIGTRDSGSYTLTAIVDENNSVAEMDDSDNSYSNPDKLVIGTVQSADLVGKASWSPSTPGAGNPVTFTVNLKNQGNTASAGGSHAVTLALRDGSGKTIKTFSGGSNGALAPAASVNVAFDGTWTAAIGSYIVETTVAADANEVESKQANNKDTGSLVVYAARGASLPYFRYDTGDATLGGGASLKSAKTFNQAETASEASDQTYATLPSSGAFAQWTVRPGQGGAGVTMRFTMPDSSDGMGLKGSLDVYVNNQKATTVPLTSYYSWQYFQGDMPADTPGNGRPLFRFDEVHFKLSQALQPGDTIKIQKGGDSIEYGVDFLEIETVPSAIARPANSVSPSDFGGAPDDGKDDLSAFNQAVSAAVSGNKVIYIPPGTWNLGNMWVIGSVQNMISGNLVITGAGMWHTNIQFTNANQASGGVSFKVTGKVDFSNMWLNSNLRSRYGQQAIYKGLMDNFGTNSHIHDVWVEHFECGAWIGDYSKTPAIHAEGLVIENSRIRNNLADGINFSQGTSNSMVRNCNLRNNGDDALAVWPSDTNGAPAGVNNKFTYNTIENNWRAGGIAFFGGSGHSADHNTIKDCVGGSGIRMNTVFPGYHFQNNAGITFSDNTIINCGTSQDLYNGERGAIDLEASTDPIRNVKFINHDIINTQRDAVQFGYSGGFQNVVFQNTVIDGTGLDKVTTSRFAGPHAGAAIYTYTNNGEATFTNLTTRNVAYPQTNFIMQGFKVTIN
ncbi:hypothetical protein HK104_000560 [Borealophlyctis nickersoniae]|nr:hypothetical protein HK104_000560 [Borealophlyctis nickersoniae]